MTAEDDYLNTPGQMYLYDATKYLQQARAEYERAQKWNWYCTDKIQRAARSVVKFDTLPLTDLDRNGSFIRGRGHARVCSVGRTDGRLRKALEELGFVNERVRKGELEGRWWQRGVT